MLETFYSLHVVTSHESRVYTSLEYMLTFVKKSKMFIYFTYLHCKYTVHSIVKET